MLGDRNVDDLVTLQAFAEDWPRSEHLAAEVGFYVVAVRGDEQIDVEIGVDVECLYS